jgi:sugar transferase (PEP-CTERM/EpsH1 system associated)
MISQEQGTKHTVHICHIIFRLDFGGLENGLVNLINTLPHERYSHTIICLTYAGAFRERITHPRVDILEMHKRAGKDVRLYAKMHELLRKLSPNIVHTRNRPALDMLAPAALAGVKRLVHSEHGLDMIELHGRHVRYNLLRRLSRIVVDKYIAVSSDLAKWLHSEIGIPEEKIALIYNGVDTDGFRPGPSSVILPHGFLPPNPFLIGTIGRLEPVKDQLTLARAFCRLLELHPVLRHTARLLIVGDGALREEIEQVLRDGNALELAWLPGFRDNAADFYRTLNLFVLPSRREGISNTLLEAMATGLPIVATAVGGTPEIVTDGVSGTLVPADNVDAMAQAILSYIQDHNLLKSHGVAGRKRALEQFSLTSMAENYQRLYESL